MPDLRGAIEIAESRIRPYVRETLLEYSPFFSEATQAQVFMKLENLQHTGSFKVRGAYNKLLSLTPAELALGCVVASSGNHGAAMAHAMSELGAKGIIFVPEGTSETKVAAIRRLGGQVEFHVRDALETERHARAYAEREGMIYVSPYNDVEVVAGQGTIGVELSRQRDAIDVVFASIGGGGLISGVAAYLKSQLPHVRIVGCLPCNSPVMAMSAQAGRILDLETQPTLSDGTAGGIEAGAITFGLCGRLIDEYVLVSEEEIKTAMRQFMDTHHMLLEGAAGVTLAGLTKKHAAFPGQNQVAVICGANISLDALRTIL